MNGFLCLQILPELPEVERLRMDGCCGGKDGLEAKKILDDVDHMDDLFCSDGSAAVASFADGNTQCRLSSCGRSLDVSFLLIDQSGF